MAIGTQHCRCFTSILPKNGQLLYTSMTPGASYVLHSDMRCTTQIPFDFFTISAHGRAHLRPSVFFINEMFFRHETTALARQ